MALENTVLTERCQTPKATYSMILCRSNVRKREDPERLRVGKWVPGGWRAVRNDCGSCGDSFWGEEMVLEISGDGCMALWKF